MMINALGWRALLYKETLRFWKVGFQTVGVEHDGHRVACQRAARENVHHLVVMGKLHLDPHQARPPYALLAGSTLSISVRVMPYFAMRARWSAEPDRKSVV